jgi:hypothetical protein
MKFIFMYLPNILFSFEQGVERRLEVASRIAAAFGDSDPGRLTVTSIRAGSVVFSWTNNTVPAGPPCPAEEIRDLAERVVNFEDGSTNPEFIESMRPLPVKTAEFQPLGACADEEMLHPGGASPSSVSPAASTPGDVVGEPRPVGAGVDTLLLIVVVAMVVVGVLLVLLIVLCIVCCCRARRRTEKQRRQRDDELSCANKGIPVIFADELDDDDDRKSAAGTGTMGRGNGNQTTPDDTPASTLKRRVRHADEDIESHASPNGGVGTGSDEDDGRPPVPPPPEYPRSDPASRTSTLRSDYKAPLISDEESDDDGNEKRQSGTSGGEQNDSSVTSSSATRPLYHPQPPNTDSLPPYRKL